MDCRIWTCMIQPCYIFRCISLRGRCFLRDAAFPEGLPDSASEVVKGGGVTLSVGTIIGSTSAHANTLAWKDPETGLYFCIHGTADKETMIHIAEQVKKSS